jgi:hypothetical protein
VKIYKTTPFVPHFIATLLTAGLWAPVWAGLVLWRRLNPTHRGR